MKYKIGDVVQIKSLSDISKLIDEKGKVGGIPFNEKMHSYCNTILTIEEIDIFSSFIPSYRMTEDPWHRYTDEMIERKINPGEEI